MKSNDTARSTPLPSRPICLIKSDAHWVPDLQDGSVMHESGLVLSLVQLPMSDQARGGAQGMLTLDMVWVPSGYPVWAVMADAAAVDDTLRAFQVRDDSTAQVLLGTLAREGGGAWVQAWAEAQQPAGRR